MSTRTIEDFSNAVLLTLAEAADSDIAALLAGLDIDPPVITAPEGMAILINDGKDELCKRALLVEATGTKTLAIGDGPMVEYSALTVSGVKTFRRAHQVRFDPTGSDPAYLVTDSGPSFELFHRDRVFAATAKPRYFANTTGGAPAIELQRKTSVAGVLTVTGYSIPPDLVDSDDVFSWLAPDDDNAIIYYAALKLAEKRGEEPVLRTARKFLTARLDQIMIGIRGRVSEPMQREYLEAYIPFSSGATG